MKNGCTLIELLGVIAIIALLATITGPRLIRAKQVVQTKWMNIQIQHNERIDYLSGTALEDPRGSFTTEKDVNDSIQYFTTLNFTGRSGLR